jgi:hypothetical protein
LLREKSGSTSTAKEFKRLLTSIIRDDIEFDHLPDYSVSIESDNVVFRPKYPGGFGRASLDIAPLQSDTYSEARRIAAGWDVYSLEGEWRSWVRRKAMIVRNADTHFLSFCAARGPYYPSSMK